MSFRFYLKIKICLQPLRLLCSFVICEFPLMGDCLMCTLGPGKIWYFVSNVPLSIINWMNDLRLEFNSRNSVCDTSSFKALTCKVSGIVLHCGWKVFIQFKLREGLLHPTLVFINWIKQNIPALNDFMILTGNDVLSASLSWPGRAVLWISEKVICDMGIGFN